MNKEHFKRTLAPRLKFPTNLAFKIYGEKQLICNGKTVQIIPSEIIHPQDNPPTDITLFGIGRYKFNLIDADVYIFSFVNSKTQKTDYAVIQNDELHSRLDDYHYSEDTINVKLILTDRGLHECFGYGAEGLYMALWVNEKRNFTEYHNNWSVFKS